MAPASVGAAEPAANRQGVEEAFDRQKAKIYGAYTRALRQQPGLKGRVDLEFTVQKNGSASKCRVVHSEIAAPGFMSELCAAVEAMNFGPREVPATLVKRLDFFPL
jgi:periplasmic protein TonB